MTFVLYKDALDEFRWKLWADNNRIIADSGEGYKRKDSAIQMINLIMKFAHQAKFQDRSDE